MITHHTGVDVPTVSHLSEHEQRMILRQLRSELLLRYRPHIQEGPGPIRVMARLVDELEQQCRKRQMAETIIRSEIVNRTIGDVNLRLVVECEGLPGSFRDYRTLADELGIALPGEDISGYRADGKTYLWLREQMMECERLLLKHHYDPRIYDIYAVGNPLLRGWLAEEMQRWGLSATSEQVYLALGAMDGIDKTLRGLSQLFVSQQLHEKAVLFPEPGFGVPETQARAHGFRLHTFQTHEECHFKLTASQLNTILEEAPDIRVIYLTVTNNPTTFSYTPDELHSLHAVLQAHREKGRTIILLGDLAYIGTGNPREDQARMATFTEPDGWQHTILVSSFSKTYSLTGERFGWVTCGDPALAAAISSSWSNSMASLPGEWQLRFMAYVRLLQQRPWLSDKLRSFYRLRRQRLQQQLERLNKEHELFAEIYIDDDATVYNWSKLKSGEDAFSLFEKTGIAGVPGSGFGYTDEYIRFSIGVIPVL